MKVGNSDAGICNNQSGYGLYYLARFFIFAGKFIHMKLFTLFLFFTGFTFSLTAQRVGVGTTTPHASAVLDVSSNNKGMLPPRLTTQQRNAISFPAHGLMVFNSTTGTLENYDTLKKQWNAVNSPTSISTNGADDIISVYTSGEAKAFYKDSAGNYTWLTQEVTGTIIGSKASKMNIVVYTHGSAYAFYRDANGNGHWLEQELAGSAVGAVASADKVAVYTSGFAYAFYQTPDGQPHWVEQESAGTIMGAKASENNLVVYTAGYGYAFSRNASGTGSWLEKEFSGTTQNAVAAKNIITVYTFGNAYGFYQDIAGNGHWLEETFNGTISGSTSNQ